MKSKESEICLYNSKSKLQSSSRLLRDLYNKLWSLSVKLQNGRLSPESLLSSLEGSQRSNDIPYVPLERGAAVRVLHEAILELEPHYTSALTMSRMVETLSRAAHGLVPRANPNATLAPPPAAPYPGVCLPSPPRAVGQDLPSLDSPSGDHHHFRREAVVRHDAVV